MAHLNEHDSTNETATGDNASPQGQASSINIQQIANALRESTSREQAEGAISAITSLSEEAQFTLLKNFSRTRNDDNVELLNALYELSPIKAIHKEARRALIRIGSPKRGARWNTTVTPEAETTPEQQPRFWKGLVTNARERGEIQVILTWEQGPEYREGRILAFLLDFWQEGVKDFMTETGTRRYIQEQLSKVQNPDGITFADITVQEARSLLDEALSVNEWRGTEPHKDYRHHLPLIRQLILNTTEPDIKLEHTFISKQQDPDEIVGNFIGAWGLGDYGLAYDLLAKDSPLREGLDRPAWIEQRRQWADEAHPSRLDLGFLREREQKSSGLWLPTGSASLKTPANKDVEAAWSMELLETPLSGTLPEMPMGTAVYKETGRHWFWTHYTLSQENGAWRIKQFIDEGAAAQGMGIPELRQALKEQDDRVQELTKEHQPGSEGTAEAGEEIIWRMTKSMHYDDALLIKQPQEQAVYEDAFSRAMSINSIERGVVYLEHATQTFTENRGGALRQLGAGYAAQSDFYRTRHMRDREDQFFKLAEKTLEESIAEDQDAYGYIFLAELWIGRNVRLDEAAKYLEEARPRIPDPRDEAVIESDLGNLELQREKPEAALSHFQRVAKVVPNYPGNWINLGYTYQLLERLDESIDAYKQAIQVQPNEIRAYSELATIYAQRNQALEATEVIEQGIRSNPDSAHLRALLSSNYLARGDRKHAYALLEEAERINPNLEIVQVMRQILEEDKAKKK